MAEKDKASPATTSLAYDIMAPRWRVMEALLGGTESMRAAAEEFTPKHTEETQESYDARLNETVLLNVTEQTLDTLSGKPFSEPIKVNDDVPTAIAGGDDPATGLLYDIDLQGNNLDVFARDWFREGMSKALAHVLVDMPKPATEADPAKPRTLADDRKEKRRPYWVLIKPEHVLFARASVVDGTEVLEHIRIMEGVVEQDGFAEVVIAQIRVLEPGRVVLYRQHPTRKKKGEPEWIVHDEWETGLDYIPLVTFYANRQSFMVGKPPLLDLAWLNVAHWNSTSDQRHILKVARFPILACSGASGEDSDPVVIGPNKILYNEDPQGKFYYVEHTGGAITAGREDMEDLENQMASYGSTFLRQKSGDETATGRAIDSSENSSDLSAMAGLFEDAVAQALDFTAEMLSLSESGGSIELVKNYNQSEEDEKAMTALEAARTRKDISRKTILEAYRLRGYLPEDFDEDLDAEQILEEQDTALARAGFDLDPLGRPVKPPELDDEGNPITPVPGAQPPEAKPPAKGSKAPTKKATKKTAKKVTK